MNIARIRSTIMQNILTRLQLPADLTKRYDDLAQKIGQSREAVMLAALQAYLTHVAEGDERLEAAIAGAERGEIVDAEEVHADAEALIAPLGVGPEQRAQIRAQVRREMEKAYGVSPCE
jgi:predicted transcriptional regulator